MYIGAGVSWGIQYSLLHLPIVQPKTQTNTHHSAAHHTAAHHTAAHHTAAHYFARHLSRYARYSSPTHYLSHTNCSGHSHPQHRHCWCVNALFSLLADPCLNKLSFCSSVSDTICSLKHPLYNFKQDCCCRCFPTCTTSSPHC